ncbi:hypothetical protein [Vacuolonema iberomarrocanum]|uniref:hypothetical protein n=1 Tax=Vacuolonema iberomarrocanum TaxID=3454632 RepID=UPI001A1091EE|nr:hypothetical protein [filamentous cyanobacterium LEGE 07170]
MSRLDDRLEENRIQSLQRRPNSTEVNEVLFFQGFNGSAYTAKDGAGNTVEVELYRFFPPRVGTPIPALPIGGRRLAL